MNVMLKKILRRLTAGLMLGLLMAAFLLVVLWNEVIISVPAGHVGVKWSRFFGGTDVTGRQLGEVSHAIFPWDKVTLYDGRLQVHTRQYEVASIEGLHVQVNVSFRWRLSHQNTAKLHKAIGPDYINTLLVPEVGSVLRDRASKHTAEELYSTQRAQIQRDVFNTVVDENNANRITGRVDAPLGAGLIYLDDVMFLDVTLPEKLRAAIERKLEEAQLVEEYRFRVIREGLEAQRLVVEGEGIRQFQALVTPGLTDSYLRWSGVQATLKMAQSPNSKLVFMGNGPGGLPVLLNDLVGEQKAAAAGAPATAASHAAPKVQVTPGGANASEVGLPPVVSPKASELPLARPSSR